MHAWLFALISMVLSFFSWLGQDVNAGLLGVAFLLFGILIKLEEIHKTMKQSK